MADEVGNTMTYGFAPDSATKNKTNVPDDTKNHPYSIMLDTPNAEHELLKHSVKSKPRLQTITSVTYFTYVPPARKLDEADTQTNNFVHFANFLQHTYECECSDKFDEALWSLLAPSSPPA